MAGKRLAALRRWMERATTATGARGGTFDVAAWRRVFAAAASQLGTARVELRPAELERLGLPRTATVRGWGVAELGRALLLVLAARSLPDAELQVLVDGCYCDGDLPTRQAVLRSLALLPRAERFLPLAEDASRSHVQALFESIACENAYPAEHFRVLNFNQLVMKAVFTGLALDRIVGLERRVGPEITRMAEDYVRSREAAGLRVSLDIGRLLRRAEQAADE